MDYKLIFKYLSNSPLGPVMLFENIIKLKAELEGITYEEELKIFNEFKDKEIGIKDVQFLPDEYEEIK